MRPVVSNSTPLIHLAKIGLLNLLKDQFEEITIPDAVWHETVVEGADNNDAEIIRSADWIHVQKVVPSPLLNTLMLDLDPGEAETIALAAEINAQKILLDETKARKIAKGLNLNTIGTIGILLKGLQDNKISDIKFFIDELRRTGFFLSENLYQTILQVIQNKSS